jgi:phosphoribosylformimino-5-aminoimidazole carboxamide ribotide isomerase
VRVTPVLDLMAGRAVAARRGERATYAPVRSVLASGEGDALALARAFRDVLGCVEWYVADLDAIRGGPPQWPLVLALADLGGGRLLLDVATTTVERAEAALAAGADRVVVGLETLAAFVQLEAIVGRVGSARVVFSLDLRGGAPLVRPGAPHGGGGSPLELARRAVDAGVRALLVLDLARVGTGAGVDLELVRRLRLALPDIELLAGGGVAGPADLARLAAAGCDAVLVASALHEGRLTASDLRVHPNDAR